MPKFYHKTGCPACKVAQMKLDQKHIQYEDILVNPEDPNDTNFKLLCDLKVMQMPVLLFEDGTKITGAKVASWVNSQEANE